MRIILCRWNEEGKVCFSEEAFPDPNVLEWRGVTVFGELCADGSLRPEAMKLFSKVRKMADADDDKAQLLLIGDGLVETARDYFAYGMDRVYVYDDPSLAEPDPEQYGRMMAHFIDNYKPAAILFPESPLAAYLQTLILDHAKAQGKELTLSVYTETLDPIPTPNCSKRGELVICEIPE